MRKPPCAQICFHPISSSFEAYQLQDFKLRLFEHRSFARDKFGDLGSYMVLTFYSVFRLALPAVLRSGIASSEAASAGIVPLTAV
jgi:hypothetical protein